MILRIFILALSIAALLAGKARAAEALDQAVVHAEYENGNFDTVLRMISAFQKRNPQHSREDSVFIAKHLAVVHAANPKTVEIGKYWMYRMLTLMPSADLAEMYVNDEIDRIFDKVHREFMARQAASGAPKSLSPYGAAPSQAGEDKRPASSRGDGRKKWIWIGAGGTALVAAIAVYFVVSGETAAKSDTTRVAVEL